MAAVGFFFFPHYILVMDDVDNTGRQYAEAFHYSRA